MGRRTFIPVCLLAGAVLAWLSPLAARAQLPPRLEKCLPYPTLAAEIRDMTASDVVETVKAKATVDDVRIEGATHLPYAVRRQLIISIIETEFIGEPDNWLSDLEEVGIRGFLQIRGYFKATSRAKAQLLGGDSTTSILG